MGIKCATLNDKSSLKTEQVSLGTAIQTLSDMNCLSFVLFSLQTGLADEGVSIITIKQLIYRIF